MSKQKYIADTAAFRSAISKGLFVAYSDSKHPFVGPKEAAPPHYFKYDADGKQWLIRMGEIEVPWGFSADITEGRYAANGSILLERANVAEIPKGLNFEACGEGENMFYCHYDLSFKNDDADPGFVGYAVYLRDRFIGLIKAAAQTRSAKEFEAFMRGEKVYRDERSVFTQGFAVDKAVQALLDEHHMEIKLITAETVPPLPQSETDTTK